MRHLGLWVLPIALGAGPARAAQERPVAATGAQTPGPILLSGRLSLLAVETGATTRAATPEITIAARWQLADLGGVALSYRGGWRQSGSEVVGMITTVHRLQLGLFARRAFEIVSLGAELGAHARYQTLQHRGAGTRGTLHTSLGLGAALDGWVGLEVTDTLEGVFVLGAYQRGRAIDLLAGIGITWRPMTTSGHSS